MWLEIHLLNHSLVSWITIVYLRYSGGLDITYASMTYKKSLDYCRDLVRYSNHSLSTILNITYLIMTYYYRRHDHDAYLTSLFSPPRIRPVFWALHAFNIETALLRDTVSDAKLGQIRLVWWKQAIQQIFSVTSFLVFTSG